MERQMKTIAQIVCVSTILLATASRIGADDSKQFKPLFEEVREAIISLKPGTSEADAQRILLLDKLSRDTGGVIGYVACWHFHGFANEFQSLQLLVDLGKKPNTIFSATLRDGNKIVAKFDDDKK
jgi:hypothetical protein